MKIDNREWCLDVEKDTPETVLTTSNSLPFDEFGKRIHVLLQGLEIFPYDNRVLTELGKAYYAAHDFVAAKNCFESVLKTQPDSLNGLFYMMLIAYNYKNDNEVEKYCKLILSSSCHDSDRSLKKMIRAMTILANLYAVRNQLDDAEDLYESAYQLAPNDFLTMLFWARLKKRRGKTAEAITLIRKAHVVAPLDDGVLRMMSELRIKV